MLARLRRDGAKTQRESAEVRRVPVPSAALASFESFHDVFSEALGFPEFYGRNMNAWIDCMSDVDDPPTGMTRVHVEPGEVLVLDMEVGAPAEQEVLAALVDCAACVNRRFADSGSQTRIALALVDAPQP